jgi:predicted RNA-binding protein with RPS1 domain
MTKIEVGAQLQGLVKNITDFGAFVDLGGVDGLYISLIFHGVESIIHPKLYL